MHDLDRTYAELEPESFEFTAEDEYEGDYEGEYDGEYDGEVLDEADLQELAAELLSVSNEAELDQFLGGVIRKVGRAVGKVVRSPVGRHLGGVLKGVAKKALPMAGAAIGNYFVPGAGGAIGRKLGTAAGKAFGLELEGLSQEDAEFEVAKQFVRLAADATNRVLSTPEGANAAAAAKRAVSKALRRHAPGLRFETGATGAQATSGRWVRRGNTIILYGV